MSLRAVRPVGRDMDVVSAWCSGPQTSAAAAVIKYEYK